MITKIFVFYFCPFSSQNLAQMLLYQAFALYILFLKKFYFALELYNVRYIIRIVRNEEREVPVDK